MRTNNIVKGQMEVRMAKFAPFQSRRISREIALPSGYGKDRIVAMVRDPWWIFAYWEITQNRENAVRDEIEKKGEHFAKTILRVYDITANSFFDITLRDMAANWYIDVGLPDRRLSVEIGMVTREGAFYPLAKSNIVHTPRFGISDILDTEWMSSEERYLRLFGTSYGIDVIGKSSLEMKELFQRRIKEWISSGGVFSFASHILKK